ncbi:multicopper oxidase family protein [Phyllobacterium sp. NPDC097923]|uniref:multicopper oxidase family protein n=1 Tax=Phyllobacterium sp. NPDC097923 TaxID=3364404 RepID=UPI00383A403D
MQAMRPYMVNAAALNELRITASPARSALTGSTRPETDVWAYDSQVPGPTLRIRQGEPARITVANKLDQGTTVHWHGIRLPIAMDGVPSISQPLIEPGETFTYTFTPPDAGTYWYHPHANSLQQLGRGLSGVLIVEEREPVSVDRDIVWMLSDWRLATDGGIVPGFGNAMEAEMSGRIGNTVTLNGVVPDDQPVQSGERIRLRLVNGALARIMALRFEGHRPVIVAINGQPCEPHEPEGGRILLGPAMRTDLIIDMQGEPNGRFAVIDDFYKGDLTYALTHLAYSSAPHSRKSTPDGGLRLPANPLPEPDLATAKRHDITLQGGMMGGGALKGVGGMSRMSMSGQADIAAWSINGMSMTGDGQAGMPPLLTLQRGRSHVLTIRNETAWWHPMHFHGHSLKVLSRNGLPVPHHQWSDTILFAPKDTVECAFVADNPGDWMLHCHVMDHQVAGLMTILRVA